MEVNENQYFTKSLKIFDELENSDDNVITITESSNMVLGSGSRVWESSIILGKYAIKKNLESNAFSKCNILELGAGTGLLSIILAALGNKVYATDIPEILSLLETNIEHNKQVMTKNGSVKAFALDWNFQKEKIKELFAKEQIKNLNHIFASDVILQERHVELFFTVLQNIIEIIKESSDENHIPSIYLAYKEREEELDKLIFEEADERGFLIQEIDYKELDPDYVSGDVHVYFLEFDIKVKD